MIHTKSFLSLLMLCSLCHLCYPGMSQSTPAIEFTEVPGENAVVVNAEITDSDDDLSSVTLYAIDEQTLDVLWTEHRIVEGGDANLSFVWPRQSWMVSNGSDSVQPVLAVNTIDMPPEQAPYLAYSAPCLLEIVPGSPEITALAYFDNDGQFHSLVDLSGNSYYRSRELFGIVNPALSYGRYIRENITMIVGVTSLSFLRLNLDKGLSPLQPLILERSPIQHYTLRLERVAVGSTPYIIEVEAEDSTGNGVRKFSKNVL